MRGTHGETPLIVASHLGRYECMWWLLEGGANPNLQDEGDQTALSYAESMEAVELLLQRGADPRIANCGWQALRLACQDGRAAIVQTLLDRGVEPDDDELDPEGPTPMMLAAFEGHLACVQQIGAFLGAWAEAFRCVIELCLHAMEIPIESGRLSKAHIETLGK